MEEEEEDGVENVERGGEEREAMVGVREVMVVLAVLQVVLQEVVHLARDTKLSKSDGKGLWLYIKISSLFYNSQN